MSHDTLCYKPSGKFSPLFFVLFLLIVPVSIPILSYLYIHIIYFMPYVYFNLIVSLACGAGLGLVISFAMHVGKVRSLPLTIIASLLAVILMKYVMWTFYIPLVYSNAYEVLEYTFLEGLSISSSLFLYPTDVWEFMKEVNSIGVWTLNEIEVKGVFLTIIWIGELGSFIASCIFITYSKVKKPFCEENKKWFKRKSGKIKLNMPENIDTFKDRLVAGNYDQFQTLLSEEYQESPNHLNVQLFDLDDVHYGYATIQTVELLEDKKGKTKEKEKDLVEYLKVDGGIFTTLSNRNFS